MDYTTMKPSMNKLLELQTIISKMPLEVCCVTVIPEFGVRWKEVSHAIRKARLPMHSSSVARVLCRHAAKSLPQEELDDILGHLKLKLVATQTRTWHVIHLLEPTTEEPVAVMLRTLPHRVLTALRSTKNRGMRPEVKSVKMGDLVYLSLRLVSDGKANGALYVAVPVGQPVALLSSIGATRLIKACVEGLGFSSYSNAGLHGKDITSLLRIADPAWNANADHLGEAPPYEPAPVVLPNGIDYTNEAYNEQYVDDILGPNPPVLTELNVKTTSNFFDTSRLNKTINLTISLKSDDVSKTLRSWVVKGAIPPTSEFFQIFHKTKSNRFVYNREDSD